MTLDDPLDSPAKELSANRRPEMESKVLYGLGYSDPPHEAE